MEEQKRDSKELAFICGFTPCHFAVGTKAFANIALDEKAILKLNDKELQQLAQDNKIIFEKCKTAMFNNGMMEEQLENTLKFLKVFGY